MFYIRCMSNISYTDRLTMRAITQDRYGDGEVLRLQERPAPQPQGDQVLVRMRAAGVGPDAWHLMSGKPYLLRLGTGPRRPRPRVLGSDVAGIVTAVGADVTRFRVGDEVYGGSSGSFAELVVAREKTLLPKPASLSFEHAAAVATSGVTALQALRAAGVSAGSSLLVVGAGGGVGVFAVQLARLAGATVTGVCSTGKVALARELGCDAVIDYTRDELTGSYDAILDIGGSRPIPTLRALLRPGGTAVLVGGEGGGDWLGALTRNVAAIGRRDVKGLFSTLNPGDLAELDAALRSGSVRVPVQRSFALERAGDAVDSLMAGAVAGKIVLVP
jgi:NADPH:quinone reductase-like Zn-dependent oxidoreductase